jgi:hypothetical protein
MSFRENLFNDIKKHVENYIEHVSLKFNIDKNILLSEWEGKLPNENRPKLENVDLDDLSRERLLRCNKAELSALCKSKGLKLAGKKEDLLDRLLNIDNNTPVIISEKKVKNTKKTDSEIIKKITSDIPVFLLKQNDHGNFEHAETGFVFDKHTETVIGKQEKDGTISELLEDDIETCKKFKFQYHLPKNLDKNNLDNVKIQELEDDDLILEEAKNHDDIKIENSDEEIDIEEDDDIEEDEEGDDDIEDDIEDDI